MSAEGFDVSGHLFEQLRSLPVHERPSSEGFTVRTLDQLAELPPPTWLIDGLLPEGLAVLFGQPSSFKSFIALDWALSVATGTTWHGRDVKDGSVLYVAAEGVGGLVRRADAWLKTRDLRRADASIYFLTAAVDFVDPAELDLMEATLQDLPDRPELVVIDTMARTMVGADENSSRDVGRFIAGLDGLDVGTRLVVHHTGKNGESERGSGALRGAADVMARVDREGESRRIELVADKPPKDAPAWPTMTLQAVSVDGSLVFAPVPQLIAGINAEDDRQGRILAFVMEHGPVSRNKIENGVGGKRELVRSTLADLVINGRLVESKNGQAKVYSEARPGLWGEVGAKRGEVTPSAEDGTSPPGRSPPLGGPPGRGPAAPVTQTSPSPSEDGS